MQLRIYIAKWKTVSAITAHRHSCNGPRMLSFKICVSCLYSNQSRNAAGMSLAGQKRRSVRKNLWEVLCFKPHFFFPHGCHILKHTACTVWTHLQKGRSTETKKGYRGGSLDQVCCLERLESTLAHPSQGNAPGCRNFSSLNSFLSSLLPAQSPQCIAQAVKELGLEQISSTAGDKSLG